jgi:hypothetical protein
MRVTSARLESIRHKSADPTRPWYGNRRPMRGVWPWMSTLPVLRAAVLFVAIIGLTACSVGGAPTPGPSELIDPNPNARVGNEPSVGGGGLPGPGANGELTVPQPGQLDVHPVTAESLEAAVDGRRVTIKVSWTSGIEPCYVLDSIRVDEGEKAFAIMVNEGHAPGDSVCIEIAKFKFALVDLGELEPGTYTISDATGGAAPIEVIVG